MSAMNARFLKNALLAGVAVLALSAAGFPDPPAEQAAASAASAKIVLAGGCFWGMEGVFESLRGVSNVVSGYSGGAAATAHYELVSTGTTGHAESVEITYDPAKISFGELLKVYFSVAHDPTQLNYQGPDEGTQYRSAIFYSTPQQRDLAEAYIHELGAAKTFSHPIVTQVVPLRAFYPAEAYHQHFMQKNPNYPYIVYNDKPKLDALKRTYPSLLKSGA
jgi:peptide-methionine (S)-S-oxide reductase